MIRLIIKFWPALIPIVIYVAYMFWRKRHAKKNNLDIPHLFDGPWVWAVAAMFAIIIGGFIIMGVSAPTNPGTEYEPAHLENGKIIPERLH